MKASIFQSTLPEEDFSIDFAMLEEVDNCNKPVAKVSRKAATLDRGNDGQR